MGCRTVAMECFRNSPLEGIQYSVAILHLTTESGCRLPQRIRLLIGRTNCCCAPCSMQKLAETLRISNNGPSLGLDTALDAALKRVTRDWGRSVAPNMVWLSTGTKSETHRTSIASDAKAYQGHPSRAKHWLAPVQLARLWARPRPCCPGRESVLHTKRAAAASQWVRWPLSPGR